MREVDGGYGLARGGGGVRGKLRPGDQPSITLLAGPRPVTRCESLASDGAVFHEGAERAAPLETADTKSRARFAKSMPVHLGQDGHRRLQRPVFGLGAAGASGDEVGPEGHPIWLRDLINGQS